MRAKPSLRGQVPTREDLTVSWTPNFSSSLLKPLPYPGQGDQVGLLFKAARLTSALP